MTFFEKFLYFLEGSMTRPENFGWFHLVFVALVIVATVLICIKFKDSSEKTINKIMLIAWIILIIGETVKQVLFSFEFDGSSVSWCYQWYAFPYQLCGTPLVILPLAIFLKEGKIRDACITYLATFSLFGGIAVYFYPNDVFVGEIAINIQSMIHHGLQIIIGVFLAVHTRCDMKFRRYIGSVGVFAVLAALALVMNVGMYHIFTANSINDTFNMFFISPYYDCTLPVLSAIYPKVPYPVFLAIYILGFMIISAVVFYGTKGIYSLVTLKNRTNVKK